MRYLLLTSLLALLASPLAAQTLVDPARNKEPLAESQKDDPRTFMRLIEDEDGGFMQVLVATYKSGDRTLTLYGCVHVADRAFYVDMQKRFTKLDALLYELIGEADMRPYPTMELDGDN